MIKTGKNNSPSISNQNECETKQRRVCDETDRNNNKDKEKRKLFYELFTIMPTYNSTVKKKIFK